MESREELIEKYGSITNAAKALGIHRATLQRRLKNQSKPRKEESNLSDKEFKIKETNHNELELTSVDERIKTVDEAVKKAEIDTNIWEEYHSEVTSWEVAMKLGNKEDGFHSSVIPLWRVHARFKRRVPDYLQQSFDNLLVWDSGRDLSFLSKTPYEVKDYPHMLEIALFDHHFGKLCWARETGIEYNTSIASDLFVNAVEDLISYTDHYNIEEIKFPIGQDFFNVNNWIGETQHGTRQDVDTRFQRIFEIGCQSVIQAIEYCLTRAPVEIIWVPGNHDWETSWYLTKVIDARFHNNTNVKVDKSPQSRKYISYGTNLIGLTHGDKEKHNKLAVLMATERPTEFAKATDKRWHLGHFHQKGEEHYVACDGSEPIIIEKLPSMSGTDSWHYQKGYVNGKRAAMAYLYSKSRGLAGNFWAYARE